MNPQWGGTGVIIFFAAGVLAGGITTALLILWDGEL